jgi:hypothetical protein
MSTSPGTSTSSRDEYEYVRGGVVCSYSYSFLDLRTLTWTFVLVPETSTPGSSTRYEVQLVSYQNLFQGFANLLQVYHGRKKKSLPNRIERKVVSKASRMKSCQHVNNSNTPRHYNTTSSPPRSTPGYRTHALSPRTGREHLPSCGLVY